MHQAAALALALVAAAPLAAAVPPARVAATSFEQLAQPLPLPYQEGAAGAPAVAAARTRARAAGKLLLVDLGGNWCLDCRILAGTMELPELKRWVAQHYELVTVDVGRFDRNLDVPARWGITGRLEGVPSLLVVDPRSNRLLNAGRTAALADARHMSPQGLADYLARWALTGIAIRPATVVDLPALQALVQRAYRGEASRAGWTHEADIVTGGERVTLEALTTMLADPARTLLVADEEGTPVGSVELVARGDGLAYLGLLSVEPARQAGGLGALLVAAAEEVAQAGGATRIEMTVIAEREPLIAWYERKGYARTGERRPFPPVAASTTFRPGPVPEMVVLEKTLD